MEHVCVNGTHGSLCDWENTIFYDIVCVCNFKWLVLVAWLLRYTMQNHYYSLFMTNFNGEEEERKEGRKIELDDATKYESTESNVQISCDGILNIE